MTTKNKSCLYIRGIAGVKSARQDYYNAAPYRRDFRPRMDLAKYKDFSRICIEAFISELFAELANDNLGSGR